MRVIITGGTGLVGRALSAGLGSDGHEVIVLSRSPDQATRLPASVRVERWDARTSDGWAHLADGADAIVNLAGANLAGAGFFPSRWTDERKQRIRDSRINAGRAVVQAVEQASRKPRVVIQASGLGYYGFHGDEELTEEAPAGNDFLARLAARDWEPATAAVEAMGVRRAVVRSGVILSAQEGALLRLILPVRLFVGGPMGSGKQWMSWIHLEDEARAIRFLIENDQASGPFNLAAPNPVTNAAFMRALGHVLHRPSFLPLPGFALRLAFGEVSDVVLEGQRVVPRRLLDLGFQFHFSDVEAALHDVIEAPARLARNEKVTP
jgi:uncharacterized protein (TIGR01777 family)